MLSNYFKTEVQKVRKLLSLKLLVVASQHLHHNL